MKPTNSIVQGAKKPTFSMVINSATMQNMISTALKDSRRAASFTSTLISAVSANTKLAECRPESVISAALRGEGMNLSLALGQYSIVPYGDSANYQISYKGISQLAIRSGQYADFGVFDVRDGEYKGKDPRTRKPVIEWIEDEDEREKKPLVGFYGFYELKDGFFKSIYWSHEKILLHADRYSKAFNKATYDDLLAGKIKGADADRLRSGSPWYGDPLSEAHQKMCKKTLLIQMLNDGTAPLSIEMQTAFKQDTLQEKGDEIIYADDSRIVNTATGEIVADVKAEVVEQQEIPAPAKKNTKATQQSVAYENAEQTQMNFADMKG